MTAAEDADDPTVADRAAAQAHNGWGPIPLPTGKKAQPPRGFTGGEHPMPGFADWYATFDDNPAAWGNLGARIPEQVVGVDVDAYDGKNGAATWKALGGPDWPDTVVLSSRFAAGYDGASGIRFYRLPDGVDQGDLWGAHDGIEILRFGHRYAVSPGSDHPNGGVYRLFDTRTREFVDVLPPVDTLPVLTLDQGSRLSTAGAPWRGEASEPRAKDPSPMCAYTSGILNRALGDLEHADSRYGTMSSAVWALVAGEDEGHHLGQGLTVLRLAYFAATAEDRKASGSESPLSEFDRNLRDAYAKVAASPTDDMFKGCCSTDVPRERVSVLEESTAPVLDEYAPDDETSTQRLRRFAALEELRRLVAHDDAKTMLAESKAGAVPELKPIAWPDFASEPDEEECYRVADLWPAEGRVMLSAAAKSGKTTMIAANLIPSLLDGRDFLGRSSTQPVTGGIVYLNMEVGPRILRRWMRDAGVPMDPRLLVVNLRGKASTLTLDTPAGRQRLANVLMAHDAEIVILDPLAPVLASLNLDENSNSDVARFFGYWSEALALAGVKDDLIVHHTGHAGERSRGASRLNDEPDAIWTLTKSDGGEDVDELDAMFGAGPTRYLQAYGRDVDLAAEALEYDPQTHALTLTGQAKGKANGKAIERKVIAVLATSPGMSREAICKAVGGKKSTTWTAIQALIESGEVVDSGGKTNNGYPLLILRSS